MAQRALTEITPWRRRSLTIPPDSWRAWVHLAVWEAWMGMLLCGFMAFGVALIATSRDRIITAEDLSACYAPPPVVLPCDRIVYRTGALNAAFTALGGMLSILAGAWFLWELWGAVAPKPITDDFLRLLNDSFGRNWRDPRTWPWSRMLLAYGFTFVGVLIAAGAAGLVWTAVSFARPIKEPVVKVETSQDFRIASKGRDSIRPSQFLPGGVMSAHLAADLAVTLDSDRPGALAKALGCVSDAGINIDGYSEMNGIVHILATELAATRECLHKAGFRELQRQEVVVVPVEDEPGAAAGVFQRIAEAHINVRYTYLATGNRLVIAAGDPQAVIKALKH